MSGDIPARLVHDADQELAQIKRVITEAAQVLAEIGSKDPMVRLANARHLLMEMMPDVDVLTMASVALVLLAEDGGQR